MSNTLRTAIAQFNYRVGDLQNNRQMILHAIEQAKNKKAELICFPELALCGYPPEDLLTRNDFKQAIADELAYIEEASQGIAVIIGHPHYEDENCFNAASIFIDGTLSARYYKRQLPNYGVFDEKRYFTNGQQPCVVNVNDVIIGIMICEDLWDQTTVAEAVAAGAQCIISLNASPFHQTKSEKRENIVAERAKTNKCPIVYVHMVGGQDELVFDGGSMLVDNTGELYKQAPFFRKSLCVWDLNLNAMEKDKDLQKPSHIERIYSALTLGLKDYVYKNGFEAVAIGVSGGIDSALTLALAVDALGAENATGIMLASRYTSKQSIEDAKLLCENFGVEYEELSIEPMFQAGLDTMYPLFAQIPVDTTEENMQARIRGVLLMAYVNKYKRLLLTTGNKSEYACGYATLYGDMAGAFAPLKDVYKTLVYELANYRNRKDEFIPKSIIEREPTAELAPNQKDGDSLPPYPELDGILERFIEQEQGLSEIVDAGFALGTVEKVVKMVIAGEYKRRQAAPGVRITTKAFGRDRRYPITSGFDYIAAATSGDGSRS